MLCEILGRFGEERTTQIQSISKLRFRKHPTRLHDTVVLSLV